MDTRFGIFITVRTDSSRLPQKALLHIRGRKIIEHVIDRAKMVRSVDQVILCTSTAPEDTVLADIARINGIAAFRGSLADKLARWRDAADQCKIHYFVEYEGDDVFCDPEIMELAITQMKTQPCDILTIPKTLIVGGSAFCLSVDAVRRACTLEAEPADNWVPYLTETDLFKTCELRVGDPIFHNKNIRLTLDYPEDLEFFRRVFNDMDIQKNTIPLRDILQFLENRPDLVAINWFRQKDYLENQKRITSLFSKKKPH